MLDQLFFAHCSLPFEFYYIHCDRLLIHLLKLCLGVPSTLHSSFHNKTVARLSVLSVDDLSKLSYLVDITYSIAY